MSELSNYRAICNVLLRHSTSPQAILAMADELLPLVMAGPRVSHTHDALVQAALSSTEVMDHMRDAKKIYAIKALRALTYCGLKDAKEAVEDTRVISASGYPFTFR